MKAPTINSHSTSAIEQLPFDGLARSSAPRGIAASLSMLECAANSRNDVYAGKSLREKLSSILKWFTDLFKDCYAKVFGPKERPHPLEALLTLLDSSEVTRGAVVDAFRALSRNDQSAVQLKMRELIIEGLCSQAEERVVERPIAPQISLERARELIERSFDRLKRNEVILDSEEEIPDLHQSLIETVQDLVGEHTLLLSSCVRVMPHSEHKLALSEILDRFLGTETRKRLDISVFLNSEVEGRDAFIEELKAKVAEELCGWDRGTKQRVAGCELAQARLDARTDALNRFHNQYSYDLMACIILGTNLPEVGVPLEGQEEDVFSPVFLSEHLIEEESYFRLAVELFIPSSKAPTGGVVEFFKKHVGKIFGSKAQETLLPLQTLQILLANPAPEREVVVEAFRALPEENRRAVKLHMKDHIIEALARQVTRQARDRAVVDPITALSADRAREIVEGSFIGVAEQIPDLHESLVRPGGNPLFQHSVFRAAIGNLDDSPHKQGLLRVLEAWRNPTLLQVNNFLRDNATEGRAEFAEEVKDRMARLLCEWDTGRKERDRNEDLNRAREDAERAAIERLRDEYRYDVMDRIIMGYLLSESSLLEGPEGEEFSTAYLSEHLLDVGSWFRNAIATLHVPIEVQEEESD